MEEKSNSKTSPNGVEDESLAIITKCLHNSFEEELLNHLDSRMCNAKIQIGRIHGRNLSLVKFLPKTWLGFAHRLRGDLLVLEERLRGLSCIGSSL